jgi:hypothetical protein
LTICTWLILLFSSEEKIRRLVKTAKIVLGMIHVCEPVARLKVTTTNTIVVITSFDVFHCAIAPPKQEIEQTRYLVPCPDFENIMISEPLNSLNCSGKQLELAERAKNDDSNLLARQSWILKLAKTNKNSTKTAWQTS